MREVLEAIKSLVDEIYSKEPTQWRGVKKMVLHPPTNRSAIDKFFTSKVGKPLPPSYADFLGAADGLEHGWHALSFLGTARNHQKKILDVVDETRDQQIGRFETFYGEPTEASVRAWEKKQSKLFLADHAVAAASDHADFLVYDQRTRRKNGEMELCWWPRLQPVKTRYPGIKEYFDAVLKEVQQYHRKLGRGGPKKA
jgi:hypothetical protein